MLEDINLEDFPKESGTYRFISNNEVVYVGSSNNLYRRMGHHKHCVKNGGDHNGASKQDFYQFLQSNQFKVEFRLTESYKQKEQQLIEVYQPKYNSHRAFAGIGAFKGREAEWQKEYNQEFKEEILKQQKQYNHQLCNFNGETLTLNALKKRFWRKGIEHPTTEAKKYLIS